MNDRMQRRIEAIEQLAIKKGLDFFPVVFEEVPREIIWDIASYGLPTRMSHWSFGRSFIHQKTYGEMGFSKIYELILNNNPSYAFLDDTNPDPVNLLVAAHCYLPDTYVRFDSKIVKIGELKQVGKVTNHEGQESRAIPTSRFYRGNVVKILAGCEEFVQTADHQLFVLATTAKERKKARSWTKALSYRSDLPSWVSAEQIKRGDFLAVRKPSPPSGRIESVTIKIQKKLHKQNILKSLKVPFSEDMGLLVGLYLAEGYARSKGQMGLRYHSEETDLHAISKKLISKLLKLKTYTYTDKESHSTQICFNEVCIAEFLRLAFGNKCWEKYLPEFWLKSAPLDFLKGVFIGFMKGDGNKREQRSISFTTTSSRLAIQIQQIGMMLGFYMGIDIRDRSTPDQPGKISFTGRCSGKHDNMVRRLLGMKERKISRTWNSAISYGNFFLVKVQKIKNEKYEGQVCCLNVEEGHSFELANGVLTHNCLGHSDFFKKNICFAKTNRNMVNQAERNAKQIDEFKDKFGIEQVENWMDIAFALDRHLDWTLGEERNRYPEIEVRKKEKPSLPFADLFGEADKPQIVEEIVNTEFPPYPEKDILWFLINYAKMLPWQKEIFAIVRSESFYFYPQFLTKIMNEGWASFWHAELMMEFDDISPEEHLDFSKSHSGVVSAGPEGSFNPYYVGFRIFTDIKNRWDEYYEDGQKDAVFQRSPETELYDEKGKVFLSKQNGFQKIFSVREEDDDVSFLSNFLTKELCEDMKLFTYGLAGTTAVPDEDDIILKKRSVEEVVSAMTARMHNYGAPHINITKIDNGILHLSHGKAEKMPLDEHYATETLKYIHDVWGNTVVLSTYDRFGKDLVYKRTNEGVSKEDAGEYGKEIDLRI